jgi:alpha-L-fucosidase
MTNYGPISEVWFDMGKPTPEQSRELASLVRTLQPNCLVSGRIWNDQGDFAVMGDNATPDFRVGTLWQTPASMFHETWGYRSWQVRGDAKQKAVEKLTTLIKIVSNGGNYLLNIGPMGDGSIVPFERDVLTTIGAWFNNNGEAIYNTTPSVLPEQSWGVITSKPQRLYLSVINAPEDGRLILKGMKSRPTKAYLLADKTQVAGISEADGSFALNIAPIKSNDLIPVIAVEYEGELQYLPSKLLLKTSGGGYLLTAGNSIKYHSYSGKDYYTTKPTVVSMEWLVEKADKGAYKITLTSSPNDKGKQLHLVINGKQYPVTLSGEPDQVYQSQVMLNANNFNSIRVRLADGSNPHKDMGLEGLQIRLEK